MPRPSSHRPSPAFAELHALSCGSFLEGAVHPEDLVAEAARLGLSALALTDRDGVYHAPRFHAACREHGLRGVFGAEVTLEGSARVVLLVEDARGWRNLCRLITQGRGACEKGRSKVTRAQLAECADGLVALSGGGDYGVLEGGRCGEIEAALLAGDTAQAESVAAEYVAIFGRDRFALELHHHYLTREDRLRGLQEQLARRLDLTTVASNAVHYATPNGRALQDVLTAIRTKAPLDEARSHLLPNGEFHLKGPQAMASLMRSHPRALERSLELAHRCRFTLDALEYRLPGFEVPDGETPFSSLHGLANRGARKRYRPFTPQVARQLAHELDVIDRMGFAGYFLIVWDIVRFCAAEEILCQGRGSAANSVVCYALGVTHVDPIGLDLLFERFLSEERAEAPDIDLDIEHERREEVLQYVYAKYGREHAGMVCTFITYHARSAVRDVGKALGLSEAQVRQANKVLGHLGARDLARGLESGEVSLAGIDISGRRMRHLATLCGQIDGFPRHLSIHTGGMVISAEPLATVVPVEPATMPGRTVIQWDKDDVSAMKLVKIDLLGLGGLTLVHRAMRLLRAHRGVTLDLAHLTPDDPKVYDMMCAADTIGVFQIESRAQMNTLPRLRPRRFYDLVIEVALIRPGPIQGDMVHPFLRRRQGREPVTYPHPSLEPILARTLGIPLFQEQGMRIAVAAAGFTASEADELRRAMGHRRSHRHMASLAKRLMDGMARNGISKAAGKRIFEQLAAFADFGFAESHAASFALLVYATAWLRCHHPDVFVAAILNAQPMGFYAPATLVHDARRRGVRFHAVDVAYSAWDCTLEPLETAEEEAGEEAVKVDSATRPLAVRIGLRFLQGVGKEVGQRLLDERARAPFTSPEEVGRRCGLPVRLLETLARAGAFASFGADRRDALWQVQRAARDEAGSLDKAPADVPVTLPVMSVHERVSEDYSKAGLSVERQPMQLWRERLTKHGVRSAGDLARLCDGTDLWIAGLVICRQKPPTAKGFCFLTLEDETGLINVVFAPKVYDAFRNDIRLAPLLLVRGRLEVQSGVRNVRAERCRPLRHDRTLRVDSHDFH